MRNDFEVKNQTMKKAAVDSLGNKLCNHVTCDAMYLCVALFYAKIMVMMMTIVILIIIIKTPIMVVSACSDAMADY